VFHHVLCAYDASPAAEAALAEAIDLASATRARLAIVSVIEKPSANVAAAGMDPTALARTLEQEFGARMRAAADRVPDDVPLTTFLRTGHAGKEILKAAKEIGADVVVLGTRRRSRMTTNLFGSVAADVYYHSRLPILAVSTPD
jgi:nucleotide-binding universal stress UspA family protein